MSYMRSIARLARSVLAPLIGLALPAPAITLPPAFGDALVATVGAPTALAFTPDGRLLITTQGGTLRIVQGGVLPATPALSLGSKVCSKSERGPLGGANDTSRPHSSRKQPLEERVESGIGKATK